ncbi:MAG: A24 family peptidase [Microbacterium arborescens]
MLAVVDARTRRLPNRLVLPLYPVGLGLAVVVALDRGSVLPLVQAVLSSVVLFAVFALLHRGGGMGGGDVKLAGALGLMAGGFGWEVAAVGVALAFVAGGVVAVLLLAGRRRNASRRIAFGPFLVAGAGVAIGFALSGV